MKKLIILCFFCLSCLMTKAQLYGEMQVDITMSGDVQDMIDNYLKPDASNVTYKVWLKKDPSQVIAPPDEFGVNYIEFTPEDLSLCLKINFELFGNKIDPNLGAIFVVEITITADDGSKIVAQNELDVNPGDGYYYSSDNLFANDPTQEDGVDMVWNKKDGGDPEPGEKPVIEVISPLLACAPLTVNLNDGATTSTAGATIYFCTNADGTGTVSTPTAIAVSGTYYAYAQKGSEKSAVKPIVVTITPKPSLALTSDFAKCPGNAYSVTASGATTYTWTSSAVTDIAIGNEKTGTWSVSSAVNTTESPVVITYKVTGEVNNCKSDEKSMKVTVNPTPKVTLAAAPETVCSGGEVTLTASSTTAGVTYIWVNPSVSATTATQKVNPTNTTPNNTTVSYQVKAKLNGCESGVASKAVTVKPLPVITITPNPANAIVCKDALLELRPSVASGNATWNWTAKGTGTVNTTTGFLTDNPATVGRNSYTVEATVDGCKASKTQIVTVNPLPVPEIRINGGSATGKEVCSGTLVNLTVAGVSGGNYMWTGDVSGAGSSKSETPTTTPRNYKVTATAGGCSADASATLTVNPLPTVTISGEAIACAGSEVTLTAESIGIIDDSKYTWSGAASGTGKTKNVMLAAGASTATVTVTDAKTCQGTASQSLTGKTITPTLSATPNPSATPGADVTLSAGNAENRTDVTYRFDRITAPTGEIAGTGNTRTVNPDETCTYQVTATTTDALACTGLTTVVVNVQKVPLTLEVGGAEICADATDLTGKTLTATAAGGKKPYTYVWSVTGSPVTLAQTTYAGQYADITTAITAATGISGGGSYSVRMTVTDAEGGTIFRDATISGLKNPSLSINGKSTGGTTLGCVGTEIELAATSDTDASKLTYQWTVAAGGALENATAATAKVPNTATATANGIDYTVTQTYENGCFRELSHKVVINTVPTVTIATPDKTDVCAGDAVTLTATAADGLGYGYSFNWSAGVSQPTSTAVSQNVVTPIAGVNKYTVTVTDGNSCSATSSEVAVTGHAITLTMPANSSVDAGDPVTLNPTVAFTPTTDVAQSYEWTPANLFAAGANNTKDITSLPLTAASNIFTLKVTTDYCTKTGSVAVTTSGSVLAAAPTADKDKYCLGDDVTLTTHPSGGTTPYTFEWKVAGQISNFPASLVGSENPTLSKLPAGTYVFNVKVTDKKNRTTMGGPVSVTIHDLPVLTSVTPSKTDVCAGTDITFTMVPAMDPNYTQLWSFGGSEAKVAVTAGVHADYSLAVTDPATGCTATAVSPAVTGHSVTINRVLVNNATIGQTVPNGSSVTLNGEVAYLPDGAQGSVTYAWDPMDLVTDAAALSTTSKPLTAAQTFKLKVTDGWGCSNEKGAARVNVSGSALAVNPEVTTAGVLCAGGNVSLAAGATGGSGTYSKYSWEGLEGWPYSSTIATPTISNLPAGTYKAKVTVTDQGTGIEQDGTVEFTVHALPVITSVEVAGKVTDACTGTLLDFTAETSGGATYSWSGFISDPKEESPRGQAIAEGETDYTLTVRSADGCSVTAAPVTITGHTVTVNTASASPARVLHGGTVALTSAVRFVPVGEEGTPIVSWEDAALVEKPGDLNTRSKALTADVAFFTVTVTDQYGCSNSKNTGKVTLTGDPFDAIPAVTPVAPCTGAAIAFEANPSGGSEDYSYAWTSKTAEFVFTSTDENPQIMVGPDPGDYTVELVVTDNETGATKTKTVQFTVNPLPTITSITVTPHVCAGSTVDFTVESNGNTFSWSGFDTDPGVKNPAGVEIAAGEHRYILTATSAAGCSKVSDEVIVTGHSVAVNVATVDGKTTADNLKVPEGTVLSLKGLVTCVPDGQKGGLTYAWKPKAEIDGDNKLVDATTVALAGLGKKTFKLTVIDDYCGATEGSIDFEVVDANKLVVTVPDQTVCAADVDRLVDLNASVGPEGSSVNYAWTSIAVGSVPASGAPLTDANKAKAKVNIKDLAAGKYYFEILITDQANAKFTAKDTAEIEVLASPVVNLVVKEVCYPVLMEATGVGVMTGGYTWGITTGPTGQGVTPRLVTPEGATTESKLLDWDPTKGAAVGDFEVYVVAKNAAGCKDSAWVKETYINLQLEIGWTKMKDTCAALPVVLPLTASTRLGGDYTLTYDFTAPGGSAVTQTQLLTLPNIPPTLSVTAAGTYTLTSIKHSDPAYAKCPFLVESAKATVKVGVKPVFAVTPKLLALHKDTLFTLKVAIPGNNTYIWNESVYDMTTGKWINGGSTTGNGLVNKRMGDSDLRYIVTGTDNSAMQCQSTDTALIYRIPNAPVVKIDTAENRFKVKLAWDAVPMADSYTVWSRKWDPYCMTPADGGKYLAEATATNTSALTWLEPAMDSLEFYYVTANRSIPALAQTFNSLSSKDTVGYYLFDVNMNVDVDGSSINIMSIYFDMSSRGAAGGKYTVKDLFALYASKVLFFKCWNYAGQIWSASRKVGNTINNVFDVTPGMILQIDPTAQTQILQYGVLPKRLSATFLNTNDVNISHTFMWTHRLDLIDSKAFLQEMSDVKFIKYWDFKKQIWTAARMMAGNNVPNNFKLRSLLPLEIDLQEGVGNVNWK